MDSLSSDKFLFVERLQTGQGCGRLLTRLSLHPVQIGLDCFITNTYTSKTPRLHCYAQNNYMGTIFGHDKLLA